MFVIRRPASRVAPPSMKVPPKRKGNLAPTSNCQRLFTPLNESPSEKEGKSTTPRPNIPKPESLNESPSEKEGKF